MSKANVFRFITAVIAFGALIYFFATPEKVAKAPARDWANLEEIPLDVRRWPEQLTNIKQLSAAQSLSDRHCDFVARLPNLENLYAPDSKITDKGIEVLLKSKNLRKLSISRTNVSDIGAATLAKFPRLQILGVSDTRITEKGVLSLLDSLTLEAIDISGIPVSDGAICAISRSISIRSLDLDIRPLTKEGIDCLAKATHLRDLTLSGRPLSLAELQLLSKLDHLNRLNICVVVGREQIDTIATMPGLRELHLQPMPSYQIDFDALLDLKRIPDLEKLAVRTYIFSPKQLGQLKAVLPGVEILHGD